MALPQHADLLLHARGRNERVEVKVICTGQHDLLCYPAVFR